VALNIADLAEHAIDAVPDRVVLIAGDEQLTYAQLEEKANRLAHYLIDQGVKKDDKVGLYCRNRIEIVIAMLGIVKAGAILVNVNFRYVEGELKYLFENSDMVAGARAPLRRPCRQRAARNAERQDNPGCQR
jgi:acyl-CoA synthetase (AMP-forming)/AMP-acid ligase II